MALLARSKHPAMAAQPCWIEHDPQALDDLMAWRKPDPAKVVSAVDEHLLMAPMRVKERRSGVSIRHSWPRTDYAWETYGSTTTSWRRLDSCGRLASVEEWVSLARRLLSDGEARA